MQKFELLHSLGNLDDQTPLFFRREIFSHADPTTLLEAKEILKTLDKDEETGHTEILKGMLRLI